MYKIIKAEKLNEIVYLMVVEAPMVAKHCQPGQFIIVKEDDAGERIPLQKNLQNSRQEIHLKIL